MDEMFCAVMQKECPNATLASRPIPLNKPQPQHALPLGYETKAIDLQYLKPRHLVSVRLNHDTLPE